MTTGAQAGNSSGCAPVSHGPPVRTMCAPTVQQFQIRAAAANTVPAARLMVDALRLSTLQNRLRCRVDKARRSVSGTRPSGRARRIHQGSRDAAQIWNCWVRLRAGRPIVCDLSSVPCPHCVPRLTQPALNLDKPRLQVQSPRRPDRPRTVIQRTSHVDLAGIQPPSR